MLIEELIRLGRPLLEGDMPPEEMLRLITDVADPRVKNFYRHVFVVVVPAGEADKPCALAMQAFGQEQEGNFVVDLARATAAPFVLPSGGNPLNSQGYYGLPVYPCYDPHMQSFRESADGVVHFLQKRLERTPGFDLAEETLRQIARALHDRVSATDFGQERKLLGVLVLARCQPKGHYHLGDVLRTDRIAPPKKGKAIVPRYPRILEGIWSAKIEEGRQAGERAGPCTFSGDAKQVVSAYGKAWPWAFPTWNCPLANGGNLDMLVQSVAVSPETYRALTLGACVFNQLTRRVRSAVLAEIFSPADTRAGKDQARWRSASDLPAIYGSVFLLPLQEATGQDPEHRELFVPAVRAMLAAEPDDPIQADRSLTAVVGFNALLPPELARDLYRLSLVYFSGEYTRGDIHLRAFIPDVMPSTLGTLREVALMHARDATALLEVLMPALSEQQRAYLGRGYGSVPYLLARAYGGAYLWQQLEALLHRRPLSFRRVTANTARRIQSLLPQWPGSRWAVADEVGFYLSFLEFLAQANAHARLANHQGETAMPMRAWQELIRALERAPVETVTFDSVAELGFACGLLIRRFSGWYSYRLGRDRDFLKERVLTSGASLSPREVCRAVRNVREVAHRVSTLRKDVELGQLAPYSGEERGKHVGDYACRLGIVLAELERQNAHVEKSRDEFLNGFWAGYSLQGYDRLRKPRSEGRPVVRQTQE